MADNPLFPSGDEPSGAPRGSDYLLPQGDQNKYVPPTSERPQGANPAADLIRQKLANIYADEPDAKKEAQEAEIVKPRSKHQQFMHELSTSGKSLAEIQTEWHNYYTGLPDAEKHQVWQEFYEANSRAASAKPAAASRPEEHPETIEKPAASHVPSGPVVTVVAPELPPNSTQRDRAIERRTTHQIRETIRRKVSAGGKLKAKHHLQSLLFGLGMGVVVIFVFLFSFFNQFIIAPFIQPARTSAATPIILDPTSIAPTKDPEIIIPKINVEIPVDYSQTSIDETQIENALEDGVVHYPTTEMPGEKGNAAFFGHSSNNIFSPGKYKFAFVLLHELVPGDTFYLTKDGKVYVYKVIKKEIVSPTHVEVLDDVPGQIATATLITCDPPGTSLNRLVVIGQQISPDPAKDRQSSVADASQATASATPLPGNGPGLWGHLVQSGTGKAIIVLAVGGGIAMLFWSEELIRRS